MSVADGEIRRMACPRGVSSHKSCSTFTLMTSQSTRNFKYADDLCVTAQYSSFTEVETTIGDALEELTQYYRSNSLRANPDKTQVTAFEEQRGQSNTKSGMDHDTTGEYPTPEIPRCYSLSHAKLQGAQYKDEGSHPQQSTKKWGANASTLRTTALALCYSVAECAAPVWASSSHAQKLNPELKSACRAITGCLKPTNVEYLYLRNCFLRSVKPANFPPEVIRCSAWLRRLQAIPHRATVNIDESLAKGFDRPWTTWRFLNRLRT